MSRSPFAFFPFAVSLAAAVSGPAGCAPETRAAAPATPDPAVPVRTVAVERGPIRRPVRAAGTVAAKDEWDLSFKVGGVVARVAVREGDSIRRGQVLAALDATEVAAGVRQAREGLAKAERDRDRARLLRASDAIARSVADDAETGAAVARSSLEAAEFNLRNATLIAPDDGWVDRRLAEPGEVVAAGRPVLHVSGHGRGLVVRAGLPDRDVLGLAVGTPATVTIDASPGVSVAGHVAEIARSASRGTGTYQVEIQLDPARAPRGLLAGLTAKVEIERVLPVAVSVPLAAVQDGDGPSGAVFIVDGDRARRVPIRIAFLQDTAAVLEAGFDGSDRVITDGAARLSEGARVRPVP